MIQSHPQLKRNFIAFGIDYFFFALALGFMNFNTVLPTFATQLGASGTVIGVLLSLLLLAWSLPQLIAGNIVAKLPSKRAILIRMTLIGRPAILGLTLLIALNQARLPWLNLMGLWLAFVVFFGTDSFSSIAWLDLLGRLIPDDRRGRYISIWQVGKAVGLLGVAALVSYVLSEQGPPFPMNYALLFGSATLCLAGSIMGLLLLREETTAKEESDTTSVEWRRFFTHLARVWREDSRFRLIAAARVLFSLSNMAFPFFVIYATEELNFQAQSVGLFIFAQTIGTSLASILLGRTADRHGAQRAAQLGGIIALTAPLLALVIALTGENITALLSRAYIWLYICVGLADNLIMLGYFNYVYEITTVSQRPIYMGLFNAIGSFGMLGPTIAGLLLSYTSYPVLFATSVLLGIVSLTLAFLLPAARGPAASRKAA